jgi:ATP-dependent protease ClpP protease subunit
VKFLFHPSQSSFAGNFNGQQIQDQLGQLIDSEEAMARIYRDRTSLPDSEIERYKNETVTYDTEAAMKYGIVQQVGDLQIPGEQKAKLVFLE